MFKSTDITAQKIVALPIEKGNVSAQGLVLKRILAYEEPTI